MDTGEKPLTPFILSLIGGIFIILGAIAMSMLAFGSPNMMTGMMMDMHSGMGMSMMMGLASVATLVGLASGILVILGSLMLYSRPSESQLWGALIIAFSVASIPGGLGGLLVGLVLGVLGGSLALTWSPKTSPVATR